MRKKRHSPSIYCSWYSLSVRVSYFIVFSINQSRNSYYYFIFCLLDYVFV